LPQGRIEPCSEKRRQGAQLFILRPGGRRRRGVRGWASRTPHLEVDGIGTPQASCMTSRIRQKGMEPAIVGFRRATFLYSAESADLHRIWEGDRRGSNPRPSEPQSVSASPDTYKLVAVCGLGRGKTRHMEDRGPYTSASILPSIAATLLPLLPRYADIPRPTASFCASIPHRCSGAPGCNTHAVGASDETACHNRSESVSTLVAIRTE
jgi:hypothetical protein